MPVAATDPASVAPAAPAAPLPAANVLSGDQASAQLEHRLVSRWDDLITALSSSHFYIELSCVLIAIALAGVLAKFLDKKIKDRIAVAPPKFIDSEFITRPLLLLGPTFSLILLWMVQPFIVQSGIGGTLTSSVIELCIAYWLTKCVLLVVRVPPVAYFLSAAIIINAILRATRISRSTAAYLDSIAIDAGTYHITALHLVHGFVIFVVVFWGAALMSRTLESYLRRSTRLSPNARHLTVKFFKILFYVGATIITLSAIGIDLTAFAIFSGALGVGIGLGLQKLTANFVSGLTVLMERSVKIGDLIEVGGQTGWVRQLNIRYVLLETSDGREILIPNEELVSTRVVNWTLTTTLARIEVKLTISFDSDAEKARELMLAAAVEHSLCLRDPQPSCWLREFTDHGPQLVLGFWIADVKEGRHGPQSDVMFSILKKFKDNGIVLAKA